MSLKSIQLATISPIDRANGLFEVTAHSDSGDQIAHFRCSSERSALALRDAIREHADCLHNVGDYRQRKSTGTIN